MPDSTTPSHPSDPPAVGDHARLPTVAATHSPQTGMRTQSVSNDGAASVQAAASKRGTSSKLKEPDSVESFVALAYSRKGQRIAMKKKAAAAIAQSAPPSDTFWTQFADWARHDILLSVPKQMLLAAIPHKGVTRAWSQVLDACVAALRSHPASSELVPLLMAGDAGPDALDQLLEQAASFDFAKLLLPSGATRLSAGQATTLRANVTGTAALWMVGVRSMNSQVVLRSLHEHVWERESRTVTSLRDTWRRLLDVRDPLALGLACDAFVSAAEQARRENDEARSAEAVATRRVAELESQVFQLKSQLDQEQHNNAVLRQEALRAARDHDATLSHARDDHERLRTRVLRRLTREVELLDEGMLAIKREPPKVHVMIDHGDRALKDLRDEIKVLQSEVGQ